MERKKVNIFQKDNDFYAGQPQPHSSPDLNPIENLWAVQRRMAKSSFTVIDLAKTQYQCLHLLGLGVITFTLGKVGLDSYC